MHDWEVLRGRPGPLQQALGAVRKDLRIARDERFLASRPGPRDAYLQRAATGLQTVERELAGQWRDPAFQGRLGYVRHKVQAMADGSLPETPVLYHQLDRRLASLQHWRWVP